MADVKRNAQGNDRKRKYRSDGTPIWSKRAIDGPGIWATCVKGKEKQTVGELYDLFESLSAEIWPDGRERKGSEADPILDEDGDLSIEARIAKELAVIRRPRREQSFSNCQTDTPCVIFISCKPPIDPVKLVVTHIENVEKTGVTRTKHTHRLIPVSNTCLANVPEIKSLCRKVFGPFFAQDTEKKYSYKVDLRVRNHTTLSRPTIIQEVASCVPEGHTVDLEDPDIFILVEVFKSVCGVSIVKDYYRLQKFNIMEIANARNVQGNARPIEARVREKQFENET